MHDTLRFWLDRGVDGFRMDVIHADRQGRRPAGADTADEAAGSRTRASSTSPRHTSTCARIRQPCSTAYPGDRTLGGRGVPPRPRSGGRRTTATTTSCTSSFNFAAAVQPVARQRAGRATSDDVGGARSMPADWPTWVLSNHDNPRHRTRYGGDERVARAAAVLLLDAARARRSSTPARSSASRTPTCRPSVVVDPAAAVATAAGRRSRGTRTPRPRVGRRGARGCRSRRSRDARNAATLRDDPDSILHLYRDLLAAPSAVPGSPARLDRGARGT